MKSRTFSVASWAVWLAVSATALAQEKTKNLPTPQPAKNGLPAPRLRPPLDTVKVPVRQGVFERADDVGLATPSAVVVFERTTGELRHLVHRASGQEFVSREHRRPLFAFTMTKPHEAKPIEVLASHFREVVAAKTGQGQMELTFAAHVSMPLSVRVRVRADAEGLVRMGLTIGNKSDWAVNRIQFPQFAAPAALGKSSTDDALVLPGFDTLLIEAPGSRDFAQTAHYPSGACIQFETLYDPAAGLYMATYDPAGHNKQWGVRTMNGQYVAMLLAHLVPEIPGKDVVLPYDVVIGTFVGDWRAAADIYKRWAVQQPWCAKRVSQRDVPSYIKDGAAILAIPFRHEKPQYKLYPFKDMDELPQIAAAFKTRTQLPHIGFAPFGWENRGAWVGINYFPAVPSNEAWQKLSAELQKQGDYTFMLPSGFSWVVKRGETISGPAFDDTSDFERRQEMTVRNADGRPWSVDAYKDTTSWRGLTVKLCHGSAVARETALGIFLDLARLGTSLVQFDQEIGGGQSVPCYSTTHGHPPGFGNWMWTDFRELCSRILQDSKPIRPDFGLSIEGCSELAIPYMATMWGRQSYEVVFTPQYPGFGRGIGLFSYLYHEYIPVLGDGYSSGGGMRDTWGSAELRCYRLAKNRARGLVPTVYMEQVTLNSKDEWIRTVSDAFVSYWRPYTHFREYLLLGITRRPPKIECVEPEFWYWQADEQGEKLADGRRARKVTLRRPAVVAGSFEAADGSIGTTVVNATAQPQRAKIRMVPSGRSARMFRVDRSEEQRWKKCPSEIAVSLEPFGVRMIVVR